MALRAEGQGTAGVGNVYLSLPVALICCNA